MRVLTLALFAVCLSALTGCGQTNAKPVGKVLEGPPRVAPGDPPKGDKVVMSEAAWRQKLGDKAFKILRKQGTERAFTGKYWAHKEDGVYRCAACQAPLFDSQTKFKSGTGWPSFWAPIEDGRVEEKVDRAHGMVRREIVCSRCGGHLGHVFGDGPQPTGQRYCVNSASLEFAPPPAMATPKK